MIDRTTKLRWRRRIRQRKRQVEDLSVQTEEQLERHFFRRINRLIEVRRFVFSWLLLFMLLTAGSVVQTLNLSGFYQKSVPASGGTFSEGIMGSFTNANPLYATGSVDSAAARLVFSSLFTYDQKNNLVGDLVEKWSVDDRGIKYTFTLKEGIKWHNGKPLTAEDIVFTYKTIQNPDAKSPFFSSWQGIKIEAANERTVVFTLPNVLSSFPYALTNGIVPKHILEQVPVGQLRTARFNSVDPVGSGPFKWERTEVIGDTPDTRQERIGLLPNQEYYGDKPKLQQFIIQTFRDEGRMVQSFERGELNAMAGLSTLSDDLKNNDAHEHNIPITGESMVFFRTSHEILNDVKVRQALVHAVNVPELVRGIGYPAIISNSPLLDNMIGYDKTLTQLPYNVAQANSLLDQAGWIKGTDGIRAKGGKNLTFRLVAQNTSENVYTSGKVQKYWRDVGVDAQVSLPNDTDIQGIVNRHDYDALLYGISLGNDPDVFPYWHSSQADPRSSSRLNLSEYKSPPADKSLEAGRTRSDPALRAVKYRPFLEAWRNDAPAIALYQPRFVYVTRGVLYNFEPTVINSATDRYANVTNWMIRQTKTIK